MGLPLVDDVVNFARHRVVRVCDVPTDLDAVTTRGPETGGRAADAVWNRAVGMYRAGVHPAQQLCIRVHGEVVLNRAIGHARGLVPGRPLDDPRVTPLTPDTPINVFSAAKAVTAMVMALLEERGAVDLDAPVAQYFPEFARHEKHEITLRQVLAHRASVPSLPDHAFDLSRVHDPAHVESVVSELRPYGKPGTGPAYHALSGGLIMDVVARRATGRSVREILAAEIKQPLGLQWFDFGVDAPEAARVATNVSTGLPVLPPLSNVMRRLLGLEWNDAVLMSNDERFHASVMPSGNLLATAADAAAFYQCLLDGGELDGVRVFAPETVQRALEPEGGFALDRMLILPIPFSSGFMLGTSWLSLYGWNHPRAFGHLGLANTMTWADPERGLVVALLTTGKAVVGTHLPAFVQLVAEIHRQFPKTH